MRSKYEEKIGRFLDKNKIDYQYETLLLEYTVNRVYKPDFILRNGVIIEAKGFFTASDRSKMLKIINDYPQLDIRMLFQNQNNKLSKTSKTTYADWCDKNNIKCAESKNGTIPRAWLNEKRKYPNYE